ncbi:hypothetical protein Tco_0146123 [Tanacetum coccineum]
MEAKTSVERCKEVERGSVYYGGDEGVFLGLKVTSSLQGGDKEVKEASKVVTRKRIFKKRNKKNAKNKQIQAHGGKGKVKSQAK